MLGTGNNVVFLILHYLSADDTIKCVKSIFELNSYGNNISIVIVDNGSYNGSGAGLAEMYQGNKNIHVIVLKNNVGFAKGNNIGFRFAKNKLKADFIVMINNDVEMVQKDFVRRIVKKYTEKQYAVLGPKILLEGGNVNGIYHSLQSVEHYKKDLRIMKRRYVLSVLCLYPIYELLRSCMKRWLVCCGIKKKAKGYDPNRYYENIIIHGCALVFSRQYITSFEGLDESTFLYREEELLFLQLNEHKMRSVYCPDIVVRHNEDGATNAMLKSKRKKRLFVYKNMIKSTSLLIKKMENSRYE